MLARLLGEASAQRVAEILAVGELVLSSRLTLIECHRVVTRAGNAGAITAPRAARARADLERAAAHWTVIEIDAHVSEHAGRALPVEPVRTLDATHLASAVVARAAASGLVVLALDERTRRNARALGFELALA